MTEYVYAANVLCREGSLEIGNALAALVDPYGHGDRTFDSALRCYPAGTTFTGHGPAAIASASPTYRAVFPLLREGGYEMVAEFCGEGPYPKLNSRGVTDAQIAVFKTKLLIECGPRDAFENNGINFIISSGYVVAE